MILDVCKVVDGDNEFIATVYDYDEFLALDEDDLWDDGYDDYFLEKGEELTKSRAIAIVTEKHGPGSYICF